MTKLDWKSRQGRSLPVLKTLEPDQTCHRRFHQYKVKDFPLQGLQLSLLKNQAFFGNEKLVSVNSFLKSIGHTGTSTQNKSKTEKLSKN